MKLTRRELMIASGMTLLGNWQSSLAQALAADPARRRHCILLWMTGGPSQTDTFDMKVGHPNGGEFKDTATNVGGLRFSEHLPLLAKQADRLAIVRSVNTKEGDHGRGTFLLRTGQVADGPLRFPTIGSSLAKELAQETDEAPAYVSISPYRAFSQEAFLPGFLGPRYAPLTVGATDVFQQQAANAGDGYAELKVDDLHPPEGMIQEQVHARHVLWNALQSRFLRTHASAAPLAHDTVYRRAQHLMNSRAAAAFDLEKEPAKVRDAYGRGRFGQGCLMARRLIEQGVSFVEVSLGSVGGGALGWDTHRDNFNIVKNLSAELDAGWGTLMQELDERGLLESTTIIWMGEFGRTPKINNGGGRDHFPAAWTAVFAGGGIRGGQYYGATSEDGTEVVENAVSAADLLATLSQAAGIDPHKQNISELGRPIRIAEGTPIPDILQS